MAANVTGKGGGAAALPLEKDLKHIARTLDKLERTLERADERLRAVEREITALKVWGSFLSILVPALLLALLTRSLPR
ncbi:MAG TPA: hypothetical protein VLH40_06265 [Atribacteraceae bacterium]|nr:hypothetical protein [Atribacteraceae bacterium]